MVCCPRELKPTVSKTVSEAVELSRTESRGTWEKGKAEDQKNRKQVGLNKKEKP
jgi:hypothetical protein